jgi:hypothetical protein
LRASTLAAKGLAKGAITMREAGEPLHWGEIAHAAHCCGSGTGPATYTIDQAGRDNQISLLSLGGTTPPPVGWSCAAQISSPCLPGTSVRGRSATAPLPSRRTNEPVFASVVVSGMS